MDVLLREDVHKLGRRGQVVKVARGFARNYLLPRGMALTVSGANMRQLEQEHKKYVAREMKRKEEFQAMAAKLAETSVTIEANANEAGHLFGSVTLEMIRDAFAAEGFVIDARQIAIEAPGSSPIKEVGLFTLKIQLHPEVDATSKCFVVESDKAART